MTGEFPRVPLRVISGASSGEFERARALTILHSCRSLRKWPRKTKADHRPITVEAQARLSLTRIVNHQRYPRRVVSSGRVRHPEEILKLFPRGERSREWANDWRSQGG